MDIQNGVTSMDKSNVLTLISMIQKQDEVGNHIPEEVKREVFCNVESVSRAEWYDAGRNGMNPQYKITVFAYDYENELIAEFEGVRYSIYRTYLKSDEDIELYLEKKAGI